MVRWLPVYTRQEAGLQIPSSANPDIFQPPTLFRERDNKPFCLGELPIFRKTQLVVWIGLGCGCPFNSTMSNIPQMTGIWSNSVSSEPLLGSQNQARNDRYKSEHGKMATKKHFHPCTARVFQSPAFWAGNLSQALVICQCVYGNCSTHPDRNPFQLRKTLWGASSGHLQLDVSCNRELSHRRTNTSREGRHRYFGPGVAPHFTKKKKKKKKKKKNAPALDGRRI